MPRLVLPLLCVMPMLALLIQELAMQLGGAQPWRLPLWLAASCPLLVLPFLVGRRSDRSTVAPAITLQPSTDDKVVVLAAGLAHELGQPLSVARVGVEGMHMLRQMGRDPSAEYIDKTMRDVGRSVLAMTTIIEHLRELALRSNEAELSQVDLVVFCKELLAERDLWLRYNDIEISWQHPDPQPNLALVDRKGLRLVLVNLIKNAAEAVGGLSEELRRVELRNLGRGCLVVHNRGPAIPAERQEQVFDPFVSGKRDDRGPRLQGIGLYLARMTADRMQARLSVHSSEEEGTAFTLSCKPPAAQGAHR